MDPLSQPNGENLIAILLAKGLEISKTAEYLGQNGRARVAQAGEVGLVTVDH